MEDSWGRLTLTHLSCEHVLSDFLLACSPSSCTHTPLPQNHQAPGLLLPSLWLQLREQLQGCGSVGSFCAWAGNCCASPVSPAMRQLVFRAPGGTAQGLGKPFPLRPSVFKSVKRAARLGGLSSSLDLRNSLSKHQLSPGDGHRARPEVFSWSGRG